MLSMFPASLSGEGLSIGAPAQASERDPSMSITGAMAKEHVGKIRVHMRTISDEEVKSKAMGSKGHSTSWHGSSTDSKYLSAPAITPPQQATPAVENTGRWTKEEHRLFLEGLKLHGKEWKKIANLICTRTVVQIRTHAQKYFQKLAKICLDSENGNSSSSSNGNSSSSGSRRKGNKDSASGRGSGVRRTTNKRKKADDAAGGRKRQAGGRKGNQRSATFRPIDPKPTPSSGSFDGGSDLFPSAEGWSGGLNEASARRQPFPHSLVMASEGLPEVEGSPTSVMSEMNLFRFPTSDPGGVGHSDSTFVPDSAANLFSLSGGHDSTGRRLYDAIATPGGTHPHQSTATLASMSGEHSGSSVELLREVLELDGVGEDLTIRTPDLSNFSRPGGSVLYNRGPNAGKMTTAESAHGTVTPARSDSAAAASANKRRNTSVKKHAAARSAMIAGYALSSSISPGGQPVPTVGNGQIPALTIAPAALPAPQQPMPMTTVLHHVLACHGVTNGGHATSSTAGQHNTTHHHARHSSKDLKDLDDMWNLATFDEDAFVSGLLD